MKGTQTPGRLVVVLSLAFLIGVASSGAAYWIVTTMAKDNQLMESRSLHSGDDSAPSIAEKSAYFGESDSSDTNVVDVSKYGELETIESLFERGVAQRKYLTSLDESQLAELLKQSPKIFSPATRDSLQLASVQRLAQLNPELALSRALETYSVEHAKPRRSCFSRVGTFQLR